MTSGARRPCGCSPTLVEPLRGAREERPPACHRGDATRPGMSQPRRPVPPVGRTAARRIHTRSRRAARRDPGTSSVPLASGQSPPHAFAQDMSGTTLFFRASTRPPSIRTPSVRSRRACSRSCPRTSRPVDVTPRHQGSPAVLASTLPTALAALGDPASSATSLDGPAATSGGSCLRASPSRRTRTPSGSQATGRPASASCPRGAPSSRSPRPCRTRSSA